MITRAQIRAARALVGWTQADLAQASRLSQVAIKNLERGSTDPRLSTINSIETAFDQVGVMFLDAGDTRDGGIGVRLNADSDDVARSFRDHVARCSDMMSPALRASC
jgi:predicted transcriptional regulator